MNIEWHEVRKGLRPLVVAEIGAAHNGYLDRALQLIEQAKRVGAHAVKFQIFRPETITAPKTTGEFVIQDGPWGGRTLFDLYSECAVPREWLGALFDRGKDIDIPLFASVFSAEDLALAEMHGCPVYKLASCEITDLHLIQQIAETGKPLVISAGIASDDDIDEAIGAFLDTGRSPKQSMAILYCVPEYPTDYSAACMLSIRRMQERWPDIPIGFSDHSIGSELPVIATAFGAVMIEKHITLSRNDGGPEWGKLAASSLLSSRGHHRSAS